MGENVYIKGMTKNQKDLKNKASKRETESVSPAEKAILDNPTHHFNQMKKYEHHIENFGEYDHPDTTGDIILVSAEKLDDIILHIGGSDTELWEDSEETPPFDTVSNGKYYILRAIGIEEVTDNGN